MGLSFVTQPSGCARPAGFSLLTLRPKDRKTSTA